MTDRKKMASWTTWAAQTLWIAMANTGREPDFDALVEIVQKRAEEMKMIPDNYIGEGDIFVPLTNWVIRNAANIIEGNDNVIH